MSATGHYTVERFHEFLDGRMESGDRQLMLNHMAVCRDCRLAFDNLHRIDATLRSIPMERTGPDFTRVVMDRVLSRGSSTLVFRLLEKLPYILGMAIVLGVMVASFLITGVLDKSQLDRTGNIATGFAGRAGEVVSSSVGVFTQWLVEYLPFAFGKGSFGIAFFAVAAVAMLAALDRMIAKKVLQK